MSKTIIRDTAAQVQTQDPEMKLMAEARKRRVSDLQRPREDQSRQTAATAVPESALAEKDALSGNGRRLTLHSSTA